MESQLTELITSTMNLACDNLQPYLELEGIKPRIVVGQRGNEGSPFCYDFTSGTIFADPQNLDKGIAPATVVYSCCEEVSHFLHHQKNPDIFRRQYELLKKRETENLAGAHWLGLYNWAESIGCLGGLIAVRDSQGQDVAKKIAKVLLNESEIQISKLKRTDAKPFSKDDWAEAKHALGYQMGSSVFLETGDEEYFTRVTMTADDFIKSVIRR